MASSSFVSMTTKAFAKPLLHAVKYPHCSVNGVFLTDADANASVDNDIHRSTVRFVDAIPLFHSSLTLAPMMEVALTQVA